MYHLLLDRMVAEELADMKSKMGVLPSLSPCNKISLSKKGQMNNLRLSGNSQLQGVPKLAIIEEEAKVISAGDWNKIQECEETENKPQSLKSSSYQHQHESPRAVHNHRHAHDHSNQPSQTAVPTARGGPCYCPNSRKNRALSSSVPGFCTSPRNGPRRYSVASTNDPMVHNRSPQLSWRDKGDLQLQPPLQQPQPPQPRQISPPPPLPSSQPSLIDSKLPSPLHEQEAIFPAPPGRKYSLDSRTLIEQIQLSQEMVGTSTPRQVKGVFKSSTTTTRPPSEAAKLVKKVLSNSTFFVKRKNPFLFECFDEDSGVKFQLEVCKISQLNMTGIHLKRLVGDIWQYKNMCTTLVNKLCL
jgi:hypothetical protein